MEILSSNLPRDWSGNKSTWLLKSAVVNSTHDASEIIICSFLGRAPHNKPSRTPLLVGRGYTQAMEPKPGHFLGVVDWLATTKDNCIGGVLKFEGQRRRSVWQVVHLESPWEIPPKFVVRMQEWPVDLMCVFFLCLNELGLGFCFVYVFQVIVEMSRSKIKPAIRVIKKKALVQ